MNKDVKKKMKMMIYYDRNTVANFFDTFFSDYKAIHVHHEKPEEKARRKA